jgi:hypothetical protein
VHKAIVTHDGIKTIFLHGYEINLTERKYDNYMKESKWSSLIITDLTAQQPSRDGRNSSGESGLAAILNGGGTFLERARRHGLQPPTAPTPVSTDR